jgi:hypothetical protein
VTRYETPGPMNGPEPDPTAKDTRPADEQTVEMLEDLLPKERRQTLRAARKAGEQTGKRKGR